MPRTLVHTSLWPTSDTDSICRKAHEALATLDYESISTENGPAYRVGELVVVLSFTSNIPILQSVVGIGCTEGLDNMNPYVYVLRRLDSRRADLTIVAEENLTNASRFAPGEWLVVKSLGVKIPLMIEEIRFSVGAKAWEYTLFRAPDDWVLESKLLEMGAE